MTFHDEYDDTVPLDEVVVLRRGSTPEGTQVITNVPHLVAHHSPSGYEWGYEGSGPSDLALNILEAVLRGMKYTGPTIHNNRGKQKMFKLSWLLHQAFKREFIAKMPKAGGQIRTNQIIAWIKLQENARE